MFGVTKSFIATRSGLLRWQDHKETNAGRGDHLLKCILIVVLSDIRTVEYITAKEFTFTYHCLYCFGRDPSRVHQTLVTATHAVFVEHKGYRAPAAVVGLQFKHSALASQFLNITSTDLFSLRHLSHNIFVFLQCLGPLGCRKTCASEELDCYVLDSNGFVILSEEASHTGKFFGEIDGTIMDSLVQDRIYRKVGVWDHQGACTDDHSPFSASSCRLAPPTLHFRGLLSWAFSRISWFAVYLGLPQLWYPVGTEAYPTGDEPPGNEIEDHYVCISLFGESNRRAIDEVWYKRAVEQYAVEPESFVFTVDFEAGDAIVSDDDDYDNYNEEEEGDIGEEEEEEEDEDSEGGGEGEEGIDGIGGGSALPPPPPPVALPPPPPPPPMPTSTTNRSGHWGNGRGWGSGSSGWGNQHYPRKWPQINHATFSDGPSSSDARPCNKRTDLYILQPERLNTSGLFNPLKGKLTNCHVTGCERPFSVQKIPHSNLILLVVDTLCPCGSKLLSIVPREVVPGAGASMSGATSAGGSEVPSPSSSPSTPPTSSPANGGSHCPRPKDTLYRRRPPKCMNYHPE
ncbi:hypothetical protein J437_LFUL014649, partial [Ladona fulva]